jgi:hypothetical protein
LGDHISASVITTRDIEARGTRRFLSNAHVENTFLHGNIVAESIGASGRAIRVVVTTT